MTARLMPLPTPEASRFGRVQNPNPTTPEVRAALSYILRLKPARGVRLAELVRELALSDAEARVLRRGLQNQVRQGALAAHGAGEAREWARPGYHFRTRDELGGRQALPHCACGGAGFEPATAPRYAEQRAGQVAAPRRVDVLYGPVYVPPRPVTAREGAQDFAAIASRGVRC